MAEDVNERSILGPAEVSDGQLALVVARALGADPERVTLLDSRAESVDYALPSLTTAGRYWVHGQVSVGGEPQAFRVFCKHVQSWSRSPLFQVVPLDARPWAEVSVPCRTEPLVCRYAVGHTAWGRLPQQPPRHSPWQPSSCGARTP